MFSNNVQRMHNGCSCLQNFKCRASTEYHKAVKRNWGYQVNIRKRQLKWTGRIRMGGGEPENNGGMGNPSKSSWQTMTSYLTVMHVLQMQIWTLSAVSNSSVTSRRCTVTEKIIGAKQECTTALPFKFKAMSSPRRTYLVKAKLL